MRKLVIVLILTFGAFSVIRALDDSITEPAAVEENVSISVQPPF